MSQPPDPIDAAGDDLSPVSPADVASAARSCQVIILAAGEGTRVDIVTDVQMQGSVAQFGGGVVGKVAGQMVKRFAANIAAELAAEDAGS